GAALCCEEAITGKEDFLPYRPLRSTRLLLLICACLEVGADNVGAGLPVMGCVIVYPCGE
ncbi:hypothetical protein, partial [Pseudomonas inefficax]|uniref:hypothetical protein n=1 Tax=Pseudomonas inefficax TaxID=2078786 RepID=UPI002DB62754